MDYKIKMVSLGCNKNRVDAEEMLGILKLHGHTIVDDVKSADVVIINTCGFIEAAKQESIDTVFQYARYKTEGNVKYLVMTGCLAQRYADELKEAMPEVDAFVGVTAFENIAQVIDRLGEADNIVMHDINEPCVVNLPRIIDNNDVYAYLKIAEGCDNRCSYCAIPYIRGNFRSKPLDVLLKEAEKIAELGKKEIIIIAQDITRYGQDLEGNITLMTLLEKISEIKGIEWIRLMYLNPQRVSHEFIDFVASHDKVLPYFDIPVQHIDSDLLRSMHREANKDKIYDVFAYTRGKIPEACLRTTFISGFPGETDEQSAEIVEFVKKMKIDNLGVFTYSAEEGTPAAEMENQVPHDIAQKRMNRIMAAQKRVVSGILKERIGEITDVIIEGKKGKRYFGRNYRQAPEIDGMTFVNSKRPIEIGEIVKVKITNTYDYDSEGETL